MRMILLIHILGGSVGLVSGAIALYAGKGSKLHRKSGKFFVLAMLTMSLFGALIAVINGPETSVVMGLLAAYLVVTALTTVRPLSRWIDIGAMCVALALGVTFIILGFDSLARGMMARNGMPVPMMFVFGSIALLSGLSDIRVMRSRIQGKRRLVRHLWRMCFALFIATASFFLGQIKVIPEPLRIMPVLVVLALAPLVIMLYWLWRVRMPKKFQEVVSLGSSESIRATETSRH